MAGDPTREEEVTANIEAIKNKYGDEAYVQIIAQCVQDISISIAQLVDQ